jgi:YD repeat-containing protein
MRKINLVFSLLLNLLAYNIWAQSIQTPTIIQPSPQAQAFMRYGEIPVDYSTGVPNISIPLYTVKGKKLELPISISYHASGIKVNDIASEVGLGWVLNCGGIVSRTVFGKPDESRPAKRTFDFAQQLLESVRTNAPFFDEEFRSYPKLEDFNSYFNSNFEDEDPMSDRFFYSLPGGVSGIFRNTYLNDDIITLPYKPLKIEKTVKINPSSLNPYIDCLKITDENGIIYTFQSFLNCNQNYSEWYLTKMISADATDTILFNYEIQGENQAASIESNVLRGPNVFITQSNCNGAVAGDPLSHLSAPISPSTYFNTPVLKTIVSSSAIIKFAYVKDRTDFPQLHRLSDITISPVISPSTIVKNVHFTQKYFGSTNLFDKRLGLDGLTISSPGEPQLQKYAFTYEDLALPPYSFFVNDLNSGPKYNIDFWGYYNGSNAPNLITWDFVRNEDKNSNWGNREADRSDYYSRACMIKEIKYPTGGKTVFQFERNYAPGVYSYKADNHDGRVGGFRIGNITNYNEKNKITGIKTYEYSGAQAKAIDKIFFNYIQNTSNKVKVVTFMDPLGGGETIYTTCWVRYTNDIILSEPILPLEVGPGLPIMYTTVTEYNGTQKNNSGKTVYEYNMPDSPSDFEHHDHPYEWELPMFYHPNHWDKGNFTPELTSKTEYKFDGINYKPVSKTMNTYTTLFSKEFQTGIKLTRTQTFPDPSDLSVNCGCGIGTGYGSTFVQDFIQSIVAIDTKAYQEASLLTNTKNYIFDPNDSEKYVLTNTDITYNETNLGIKEQSTHSSNGDLLKTVYKYPSDFNQSGNVYQSMVNSNIIAPIIKQSSLKNADTIQTAKTNYAYWKNDGLSYSLASGNLEIEKDIQTTASSTFQIQKSAQFTVNFHLEMCVGHYILTISGPTPISKMYYSDGCGEGDGSGGCKTYCSKDVTESFTLSPGSYTITFSYNAAAGYSNTGFYGTAYYDGIASDTKLDLYATSSYTNKIYPSSVDVKIGSNPVETRLNYNIYDINGNIMSVSKTNDIKEIYIWSYNGNYPIAKIVNGDYTTIESLLGGWTAIKDFSLKPTPTLTEIKTFLAPLINRTNVQAQNMMVSIYSYSPLIGIVSETDPNGVTIYYEYEAAGRLKTIRNDDGKILKTFDYHYKQ